MIDRMSETLYRNKVGQFIERLGSLVMPESVTLEARFARTVDPVPFAARNDLDYRPIGEGEVWGQAWDSAWFEVSGRIPADWAGKSVAVYLDFNGEAMLFSPDGTILGGLTNSSVFMAPAGHPLRALHVVTEAAAGGEPVRYWVEAAANGLFGITRPVDPPRACPERHGSYTGKVNHLRLGIYHHDCRMLRIEMELLHQLLKVAPPQGTRFARVLHGLDAAVDRFADDPVNAAACRALLAPLLASPAHASAPVVTAVGHAHIDTAWLWPLRETVRKTGRTFASQLALMARYPDYVFGASQPQLYAFVKDHYPALYEQIQARVAEGRWELQGAMWVEADCNVISGESMVRQILHGKQFYRDEFGVDVRNLWLPDVFGYSAALPQMLKRAGVDYFLTQKLSWSQFNEFPHTTFRWRGIDGSEVLTHFPPENTYNSLLHADALHRAETNFREKAVLNEMMCLFGVGDGGGGPTEEMIERGCLAADCEGLPRLRFGRADAFFERLSAHAGELPVWAGELYLELHRGTLTTQARTKRGNRKLELALRETEYLWACVPPGRYPSKALDHMWKILLTNQFHDIIPGSSIHMVYEQSEREYAECLARCEALKEEAAQHLFRPEPGSVVAVNTLNLPASWPVTLPGSCGTGLLADGRALPVQRETDGTVVALVALTPQGMLSLQAGDAVSDAVVEGDPLTLENALVRYRFTADGQLVEAWDKDAGRAIQRPEDRGNVLSLYDDHPVSWDAWDIDLYYEQQLLETARGESVVPLGRGPVRQGVQFNLRIGQSTITQRVYLPIDSKRLEFHTEIDWQERHRMLRTAFPVDVFSDQASFDIQYGFIRRPVHRNTSWDKARFEVAAHRYVDLSGGDYGVALLNDCKYGHKVHERVLDLNLLRAPTHPDPDADQGRHRFAYALLPHAGALCESEVMRDAALFNQPPLLLWDVQAGAALPPVRVSGAGVSLEVLKKAERSEATVIRIVESRGRAASAVIQPADAATRVVECDLMEWHDLAELGAGTVTVALAAFEIRTFKLLQAT